VFYSDDFKSAKRAFPKYYDGKLFTYDWMRGWIMAVTLDKAGNFVSMERFMPSYKFSNPMDMEFAADGDLYMLEYGSGWFSANDDARLVKIEYNGGNRKPEIKLNADNLGGAIPFTANLSSEGTKDADGDSLKFTWKITAKSGYVKTLYGPTVTIKLEKPEIYKATLTVTDALGAASSQSIELAAGNEPPVLKFDIGNSNKSFYFPDKTYAYQVVVEDHEDGSISNGRIKPEQVSVNIDYLAEGFDKAVIVQGHRTADQSVDVAKGMRLIDASDCKACHSVDKKSIGPTYRDVALKYAGKASAQQTLVKKIIAGGGGVWGEVPMAAHPQLSTTDAAEMVKYILSLGEAKPKVQSLPVKGTYTVTLPPADKGEGVYIFRAAYKDRGANGLPGISSEETFTLRSPKINPSDYDELVDVTKMSYGGNRFIIPTKHGSYIALKNVDLTSLTEVEVSAIAPKAQLNAKGGFIEIRVDGANGKLLGKSEFVGDGGFGSKPLTISLAPTEGKHNLFFVFTNPAPNTPAGALMIVLNTTFKSNDATSAGATNTPAAPIDLSSFAGKYKMTGLPFEYITVSVKEGKLVSDAGGQMAELKATRSPDTFDADGKATFIFLRDEKKVVTKLRMEAMGFSFDGDKFSTSK
jgi:cytochrome c